MSSGVTREAALHDLLCSLFEAAHLRRFLSFGEEGDAIARALPADRAPMAELVDAALAQLRRRGLVPSLWERLRHEFPRRRVDIDRVAALWSSPELAAKSSTSAAPTSAHAKRPDPTAVVVDELVEATRKVLAAGAQPADAPVLRDAEENAGEQAPKLSTPKPSRHRRVAWATLSVALASFLAHRVAVCGGFPGDQLQKKATVSSLGEPTDKNDPPRKPTPTPPSAPCGPVPEGMACIEGGQFTMGSTQQEMMEAKLACETSNTAPTAFCGPAVAREALHDETVASFLLDTREVSSAKFADWLNSKTLIRKPVAGGSIDLFEGEARLATVVDDARNGELEPGFHGCLVDRGGVVALQESFSDCPAVFVSWYGADRFCRERGKRLPSEAEWEYAARSKDRRLFPWGDEWPTSADCDHLVFGRSADKNGKECDAHPRRPETRGTRHRDRTPDGVFDLGGNVAEWVASPFVDAPDCHPKDREPCCAADVRKEGWTSCFVVRGGRWSGAGESMRAAGRSRRAAVFVNNAVGFRCARSTEPRSSAGPG